MATMRDDSGVCCKRSSQMLVSAKQKPASKANTSGKSCGSGQGDSGVLSTNNTPTRASDKRINAPRVGRSPSIHHASSNDHVGMR